MADELIDLLDEKGNTIGTIMKSEAHKTGAWHKAAGTFIYNPKRGILLQLRHKDKEICPDMWDISCSGHVGAGEDVREAAWREIEEEIGLKIPPDKLEYLFTELTRIKTNDFISNEFGNIFLAYTDAEIEELNLQEEEVADARYFSLDEFELMVERKDGNVVPHWGMYKKVIQHIRKNLD